MDVDVHDDREPGGTAIEKVDAGETIETVDDPGVDGAEISGVRRRRIDVKLLVASLGVALGVVLVVLGVRASVTGREEQRLPVAIESITPIRGATQVLRQSQVQVDLLAGYSAVLILNGIELPTISLDDVGSNSSLPKPGEQVSLPPAAIFEPGNNTLTYTPVAGGPVERFDTGVNDATVIFWKLEDGRERGRSYSWSFTVV